MERVVLVLGITLGVIVAVAITSVVLLLNTLEQQGIELRSLDVLREEPQYVKFQAGTLEAKNAKSLMVENPAGSIQVRGWDKSFIQYQAAFKAAAKDALHFVTLGVQSSSKEALRIRERYERAHRHTPILDLTLSIPRMIGLHVEQGAGEISVAGLRGRSPVALKLGSGRLTLADARASSISVNVGVGKAQLMLLHGGPVTAHVELGEMTVGLPMGASYRMEADVGMGDLHVGRFRYLQLGKEKGLFSKRVHALLGDGDAKLKLHVGIGNLTIRPLRPK